MKDKIDKELLPMKAHYFFFNAGTAPVVPFMPTLARQLGFSSVVIGTIYTILPIVGMLAKPGFGLLADRYQKHRRLFLFGEILTALAFFMIMFIPSIEQPLPVVQMHCKDGVTEIRYCSKFEASIDENIESHYGNRTLECSLNCETRPFMWDIICENWLANITLANCKKNFTNTILDISILISPNHIADIVQQQCLFFNVQHNKAEINRRNVTMYCPQTGNKYFSTNCKIDCHDEYFANQLSQGRLIEGGEAVKLYQFWLFFGLLIISWIGMAIVVSIGDAICFSILGERNHLYGKQRLYGSLGFGLFAILAGVLVDKMSGENVIKDYTITFWMTLIIIGFDVFASTKLKHTKTNISPNILKDVGQMFLSLRCVIFFCWCILIGLGTALIWNFLLIYLEELGQGDNSMKTLQGFAMGIQCFGGELPFFFLSGWILKKIGHVNAMSLVLFGFGVRFILYSMIENPWYVLPIELLNGITFGVFYSTMASYAGIVAPPGTEATMQGLVGAIFEGIGVSIGSFIAGLLFAAVGGSRTFEIYGLGAFITFIVHVCLQMYLQSTHSVFAIENGKKFVSDNTTKNSNKTEDALKSTANDEFFTDVDLSRN